MIGCLIRYTRNMIFKAVMIVRPKNLNSLVDFFVDLSLNFELKFFLFFFTSLPFSKRHWLSVEQPNDKYLSSLFRWFKTSD